MSKLLILVFICFSAFNALSQEDLRQKNNICLNLKLDHRYESFIVGLDNQIDIVYPQEQKIKKEDVTATLEHYKTKTKSEVQIFEYRGQLFIRPDSLGRITIRVKTIDGMKEKTVNTKILTAVGKLSKYKANHNGKINKGEFRAQLGIRAVIEGYDINARCATLHYDVIRIAKQDVIQREVNEGGKFDERSRKLISKAESGDLFIFRNIFYKCPGDDFEKRLGDMIFEIE